MKPEYITLVGTTPQIVPLDNNIGVFNVAIRVAAGVTVETTLEDAAAIGRPDETPLSRSPGQTWTAAPTAVDGVITLTSPRRAVRLTPTSGGACTILQQGLQ